MRKTYFLVPLLVVALLGLASAAGAGPILMDGSGAGADRLALHATALFATSEITLITNVRTVGEATRLQKDKPPIALTDLVFELPNGVLLTSAADTSAKGALLQSSWARLGEYAISRVGPSTTLSELVTSTSLPLLLQIVR